MMIMKSKMQSNETNHGFIQPRIAWTHISIFILLNLWDLIATLVVIKNRGIEVMPMANYILTNFGAFGLTCYKILLPALMVWLVWMSSKKTEQIVFKRVMKTVNILMFIACLLVTFSALSFSAGT
jgi:hypothetical protein